MLVRLSVHLVNVSTCSALVSDLMRRVEEQVSKGSVCVRRVSGGGVLHEKSVKMRTCKNIYSSFGERKPFLFRKCPSSGIEMTVTYVDSLPTAPYNAPTVMAVHGTPGCYDDFSPLLQNLSNKGFRVIAANMPGNTVFSITRLLVICKHRDLNNSYANNLYLRLYMQISKDTSSRTRHRRSVTRQRRRRST